MKSKRLTGLIRHSILTELMNHRFKKEVHNLLQEKNSFAEEVYFDCFKKDLELMESLPNGYLFESSDIAVSFGSSFERLHFLNYRLHNPHRKYYTRNQMNPNYIDMIDWIKYNYNVEKRFLAKKYNSSCKVYETSSTIFKKWIVLKNKEQKLAKEIYSAGEAARGVLSSVTTTTSLKQTWPEIAAYVSKYEESEMKLPVIVHNIDIINKMFYLP